jgi:hypothetical protein
MLDSLIRSYHMQPHEAKGVLKKFHFYVFKQQAYKNFITLFL